MPEIKQKVDVRTYSRYMEKGILKSNEVEAHLKSLPDESNNLVWVDLSSDETESGDGADTEELEDDSDREDASSEVQGQTGQGDA